MSAEHREAKAAVIPTVTANDWDQSEAGLHSRQVHLILADLRTGRPQSPRLRNR